MAFHQYGLLIFRGPEQIRTAVEAFAELCLTTRPQDPFFEPGTNVGFLYIRCKFRLKNFFLITKFHETYCSLRTYYY